MGQIVEAKCKCGQPFLIEHESQCEGRKDRKRVFYLHDDPAGQCAFRCRSCREPVHETVPGAEFV